MSRSLLSVLVFLTFLGLLVYTGLSNPATSSRASQDPIVINKTTSSELKATIDRSKLSDEVRQALEVGRTKMLQRCEALEQFSPDRRETAFEELKSRSSKLLTKL